MGRGEAGQDGTLDDALHEAVATPPSGNAARDGQQLQQLLPGLPPHRSHASHCAAGGMSGWLCDLPQLRARVARMPASSVVALVAPLLRPNDRQGTHVQAALVGAGTERQRRRLDQAGRYGIALKPLPEPGDNGLLDFERWRHIPAVNGRCPMQQVDHNLGIIKRGQVRKVTVETPPASNLRGRVRKILEQSSSHSQSLSRRHPQVVASESRHQAETRPAA